MSKIRLKFVQAFNAGNGATYFYFRRWGSPRVRLPGLPGSAEFMAAYQAALDSAPAPIGASRSKPGSVAAAIASYYGSASFRALAASSQQVRRAVIEAFRREHGDKILRTMPRQFVAALLDAMEPTAARNWLKALRALARHCITIGLLTDDPTLGIRLVKMKGDGFHTWTENELACFEDAHPIGSRERLALALGLYTAQRRGDVIRMGRQHVRGDVLHVRQQKTGAELAIPVLPELAAVLATVPATQLTFLQTMRGTPFTPKAFTQWFAEACDKAGLGPQCTFHGLRKAACRRLAEVGCSANEIAAISGHASLREVERYTKAADQARLARNAVARAEENKSRVVDCQKDLDVLSKPLIAREKKPA
jgi:integrase